MRSHLVLTIALGAVACRGAAVVREQVTVQRGAVSEQWRLEWRGAPRDACVPETDEDTTCPCIGFSYGQRGILDLVRRPTSGAEERFALTPLFRYGESPASGDIPADSIEAVLRRWPILPTDDTVQDRVALGRLVRTRKPVSVVKLGDYDHDGQATEFLLQVGALPCGKREAVLVGVSVERPALHVFSSAAHPERPLVLEEHIWQALLKSDAVTAVEWLCGDHGGETQTEVRIAKTAGGFSGVRSEYACDSLAKKTNRLVSSEPL